MTQSTVEVQHTKIADGKREAERVLSEGKIVIPRFRADVVEGRWTAESRGERQLDGDQLRMVEAIPKRRSRQQDLRRSAICTIQSEADTRTGPTAEQSLRKIRCTTASRRS